MFIDPIMQTLTLRGGKVHENNSRIFLKTNLFGKGALVQGWVVVLEALLNEVSILVVEFGVVGTGPFVEVPYVRNRYLAICKLALQCAPTPGIGQSEYVDLVLILWP
jgi:hypothetical protein